jgi:urease accessory protein
MSKLGESESSHLGKVELEEGEQDSQINLTHQFKTHATARPTYLVNSSSLHTLMLLTDSALPLGSFAFSSGLESFLAHRRLSKQSHDGGSKSPFSRFLHLSLSSLASTALPYVLAAYRNPESIEDLDNDFDASTPCTVARRASVTQGRALLSVWERSFAVNMSTKTTQTGEFDAALHLKSFASRPRLTGGSDRIINAHFAPLWGLITRIMEVDELSAAYMFLFGHARTVISAAVRASELGPYQAQSELASQSLRELIEKLIQEYWNTEAHNAAQTIPALDLWVGRHEKLYSRIFNS